jgi:hypothetical protein
MPGRRTEFFRACRKTAAPSQLESHVLNPVVMSRTVKVNPLLVLVAILIGSAIGDWLGGLFGAFVAALVSIPCAAALQVITRELWQATAPGGTLSSEPRPGRCPSTQLRSRLPVPLLTPRLSSLWLTLVTDVDTATGRALIDSMTTEVIVHDHSIRDLIPFDPVPYDDAVRQALREHRQAKRAGR